MSHKNNANIRLPKKTKGRHTIYIDESGIPSLKDQERYFILTGVIATNHNFNNIEEFYFNLKRKYFGYIQHLHSVELFSENTKYLRKSKAQLFKIKKYRRKYIQELAYFLDTIPFIYLTIVVDKRKMLKSISQTKKKHPWSTTIGEAKRIFTKKDRNTTSFSKSKMEDIINTISQHKVLPIDYFRPLEVAYKELLEQHIKHYLKNIYAKSAIQICFESSIYQSLVLKHTERLLQEKDFSKEFKKSFYNIAFPNKKAKFLGLEIADIISYGYYLSSHHRRSKNDLYKDIWKVIERRKREIEKRYDMKCVIRI